MYPTYAYNPPTPFNREGGAIALPMNKDERHWPSIFGMIIYRLMVVCYVFQGINANITE